MLTISNVLPHVALVGASNEQQSKQEYLHAMREAEKDSRALPRNKGTDSMWRTGGYEFQAF